MARNPPPHGLRERKKRQTRATLIDAAAGLFLAQGYDNTTVDRLPRGRRPPPRTFSRYFPNKWQSRSITEDWTADSKDGRLQRDDPYTLLAASLDIPPPTV